MDLPIASDLASQALVKKALDFLPERAIREPGDEDIAKWIVVRVHDDITIDLMTEACGVKFDDIVDDIVLHEVDRIRIPFASPVSMLRMKQRDREKDAQVRAYLVRLLDVISKQTPKKWTRAPTPAERQAEPT